MRSGQASGYAASLQGSAPGNDPTGRPASPLTLSVEETVRALRTGVIPVGGEHALFAFFDEMHTISLADCVMGGVGTYAQFAALADRLLPEGHDTRTWLDERLGRGAAAHFEEVSPLDRVLPALDHVFPPRAPIGMPDWTLGGGLALALQLGHRIIDDVDIFVHGTRLRAFTLEMNPAVAPFYPNIEWSAHHLKFELKEGEGDVTFISAALQTEPGYAWRIVQGRAIALQTPEEVIVNAVRSRSERFTPQDAFDLAAVGAAEPGLDRTLASEVPDALLRLSESLRLLTARGTDALKLKVVPTDTGVGLLADTFDRARQIVNRAAKLADVAATRSLSTPAPAAAPPTVGSL